MGAALLAVASALPAAAQTPAKDLFSAETGPSAAKPQSIGFYSKGCIAGALEMPKDGPTWQVMKPSRHRAFAHPTMIAFLQRLSRDAAAEANWRGLLFGDMAQPRGGPMKDGHASHQIGLDADIYLTEMPNRRLSRDERDTMPLPSVIDKTTRHIDLRRWRPEMGKLIRTAAEEPEVQRIFVHPGIKEQLCKTAGRDRAWLNKVRPMYGHDYHFHVRIVCQPGSPNCEPQESTGTGDGCDKLDWWFDVALQPPKPSSKPYRKPPPIFMSGLPKACSAVLKQPDAGVSASAPSPVPAAAREPVPVTAFEAAPERAPTPAPAAAPRRLPPPPAAGAPDGFDADAPEAGGMPMPRFRPGG
ncbi:penicillin-insensitive murein endopeptidase [Aureimonas sp. AU12]|uniref:penicillin-insensitive murein endopeptidase n=1 Tax=Aureimonas sp. AU12 TaxID=1638161 RepID=UPI000A4941BC|nr:penicillin-insensitive murein endopeptidase [Aureimonas sp. AU12]